LGVAAEYLSKRCLPRLAKQRGIKGKYFQQDEPDSLELGRIIALKKASEPSNDDCKVQCYLELRTDCGTIEAQRNPPYGTEISAEVLRVVYNSLIKKKTNAIVTVQTPPATLSHDDEQSISYATDKSKIEGGAERLHEIDPDLRYRVQLALKKSDIEAPLKKELEEFGRIRIGRLIGYTPLDRDVTGLEDECLDFVKSNEFKESSNLSEECAKILGRYLGDFCVLLHDQLGVEQFILTGGVLNNSGAGAIAKSEASTRVQQYGLNLTCIDRDEIYEISNTAKQAHTKQIHSLDKESENGPYGAACFAAASFLQARQQEGLQEIRQLLLPRTTGTKVTCYEKQLMIGTLPNPVKFTKYALSQEDIKHFLEHRGPKWGYFQSDDITFIRWEPGE
jgi:hypothetical protein